MINDTYKLFIDFSEGYEEIHGAIINSFSTVEKLHSKLSPAENTLRISIQPNIELFNKFIQATDKPKLQVKRNNEVIFTGYVRNNFKRSKKQRLQSIEIEGVTETYILNRKIKTTCSFNNYYVSNNDNKSTSLIHQLLYLAGVDDANILMPNILYQIPIFSNIEGEKNYLEVLKKILFDYSYILGITKDGKLTTFPIYPSSVSSSGIFNDSNCLDEVVVEKKEEEFKEVRVNWLKAKFLEDVEIFNDTSEKLVNAQSYYGAEQGDDEWFAQYSISGHDIIGVSNAVLDFSAPSSVSVVEFIPGQKQALLKIYNSSTSGKNITTLKMNGDAWVKGVDNTTICTLDNTTDLIEKVTSDYIFEKAPAVKLSNVILNYYRYSDYVYTLKSKTDYELGAIVTITHNELGTLLGRITEKKTNHYDGIISYELEGVGEYIIYTSKTTSASQSNETLSTEAIQVIQDAVNEATTNITSSIFPTDENLHAYYSLNDSDAFYEDGLMFDNSGKQNHGKSYNCSLLPNSKSGKGYTLVDGSYAELDKIETTDDSIKLSTWIKTTDFDGCILSCNSDSGEIIYALYIESGKVKVSYMTSTGTQTQLGTKLVNDSNYHNIVYSVSKLSGCKVWIDGLIDIDITQIASLEYLNNQDFYLGIEREIETICSEDNSFLITEDGFIIETE